MSSQGFLCRMLSHTLQGNLSVQYIVKQSYSIQFYMNTHLFQNSPRWCELAARAYYRKSFQLSHTQLQVSASFTFHSSFFIFHSLYFPPLARFLQLVPIIEKAFSSPTYPTPSIGQLHSSLFTLHSSLFAIHSPLARFLQLVPTIKRAFSSPILSEPQFNRALVEILTKKSNQYGFLSEQDRILRCYKEFL